MCQLISGVYLFLSFAPSLTTRRSDYTLQIWLYSEKKKLYKVWLHSMKTKRNVGEYSPDVLHLSTPTLFQIAYQGVPNSLQRVTIIGSSFRPQRTPSLALHKDSDPGLSGHSRQATTQNLKAHNDNSLPHRGETRTPGNKIHVPAIRLARILEITTLVDRNNDRAPVVDGHGRKLKLGTTRRPPHPCPSE